MIEKDSCWTFADLQTCTVAGPVIMDLTHQCLRLPIMVNGIQMFVNDNWLIQMIFKCCLATREENQKLATKFQALLCHLDLVQFVLHAEARR